MLLPLLLIGLLLSGCQGAPPAQGVKIAVLGDPTDFYPGYQAGVERAVRDLNEEYAADGYTVECDFYSDYGDYETGAAIIDSLAADPSVSAVIGGVDMDVNKTAAYTFNEARKPFVVPFFLYDSVYEDRWSYTLFSMCNSAKTVGESLRRAAETTSAKRWAICAAEGEFEREEMSSFLRFGTGDTITVVDCADMSMLVNRFDEVYRRWKLLGVEGVVLFPSDKEGFDVLKKIKARDPDMVCAGDSAFDNSSLLDDDPELLAAMTGFLIADEFALLPETDQELERLSDMVTEYTQSTGRDLDTWYIQGYNAVRMIADTAILNREFDPERIAGTLRQDGYRGLCQEFHFDEKGLQVTEVLSCNVIDADGYGEPYQLEDQ